MESDESARVAEVSLRVIFIRGVSIGAVRLERVSHVSVDVDESPVVFVLAAPAVVIHLYGCRSDCLGAWGQVNPLHVCLRLLFGRDEIHVILCHAEQWPEK